METRSKKRKQTLVPPNPYQRSFTKRREILLSLIRSSSSSTPSSSVKDLRARRVFSPDPTSRVKESIAAAEGNQKEIPAEGNQKEVHFDVGLSQNDVIADEDTQIDNEKEKSDVGVDVEGQIGEKDTQFDVGVAESDAKMGEIGEIVIGDGKVSEKDVEGDGLVKSKLKSGSLIPCLRKKVYKNPASFSYKRMLPFLMDLAKDDANAPRIHPCQKFDKSVGETPPASLSTAQGILVDAECPVDDSHTSPTGLLNLDCSNNESPENLVLEPTAPKSPETSLPCTVGNFVIRDLPRLFGEITSQALKDTPDMFSTSNEGPSFGQDKFSPEKLSLSVVIPESPLIKEGNMLDKGCLRASGNMEAGSYEGESIQSTPPDGDVFCEVGPGTSSDCALESPSKNKSDHEVSRCMGENEKDTRPNSVEIGTCEGEWVQSRSPDDDASCKLGPGASKDCALESHLNYKNYHEMSRCMGEDEKGEHINSVGIGSCEGEWMQSTPPDGEVFCKLALGTSKDCALEGQFCNKNDHEKNRCTAGFKDRHPNSKAKFGILVPSSRMRLYKAPGSFSYRRLLPYLMDLSRNEANTLGALPCNNIDKNVDDGSPSTLPSQERQNRKPSKQTPTNVHSLAGVHVSPLTETVDVISPIGSSNVDCASLESHKDPFFEFAIENPVLKSVVQEPLGNSIDSEVKGSMIIQPSCVHLESASQIQQYTFSYSNHVKPTHELTCTIPDSNMQTKSPPFLVSPEPSLLKKGSTGLNLLPEEVPDDSSIIVQKTGISLKSPGELGSIHAQSNIESPAAPINLSSGSSVGILKKYPVGCRGICTCLNCASFRLHAERAFEFSRNQMQDAEEVTMELMKELSFIRALLRKFIDGVESRVDSQVPELKEACIKALRAEEWAKKQLELMNQELNIHCRTPGLPRPKVRFADSSQMQTAADGNSQERTLPGP